MRLQWLSGTGGGAGGLERGAGQAPVGRGPRSRWMGASLASFPQAAVRGFGEGFWGDNWAAIKCSRQLWLLPVTCQLRPAFTASADPAGGDGEGRMGLCVAPPTLPALVPSRAGSVLSHPSQLGHFWPGCSAGDRGGDGPWGIEQRTPGFLTKGLAPAQLCLAHRATLGTHPSPDLAPFTRVRELRQWHLL